MTNKQILSKLAWAKASTVGLDYWDALRLVEAENPHLHAESNSQMANDRANATNRTAHFQKKNAARTNFIRGVHAYQDKYKVPYQQAYNRCLINPDFANTVAEMNAVDTSAAQTVAPDQNFTPAHAAALGLSSDSIDQDETRTAYNANGQALTPLNPPAIYCALVDRCAILKNLSSADAQKDVAARHPALASLIRTLKTATSS